MTHFAFKVLAICASSALVACGGGTSSAPPVAAPPTVALSPAAGLFTGSTADGAAFNALILPDNSFWTLYGQARTDGGMRVFGALTGQGSVTGNSYSSTDAVGVLFDPTPGSSALSGATGTENNATFVAGVSVQGTVRTPRNPRLAYSGLVPDPRMYDFKQRASIATVAGRWDGAALNQLSAFIDVAADGSFTGAVGTCAYTGLLAPHPDGINAYTSQLTLGAAPCSAPGLVLKGVAIAYKVSSGKTELVVAGLVPNRSVGTLFYAQR